MKFIFILIVSCLITTTGCQSIDTVHSPSTELAYAKVVEWENYMIKGKLLERESHAGPEPEEDPPDGILTLRFQDFIDAMEKARSVNNGHNISTHELKRRFYDPIVMKYGITQSLAKTSLYSNRELEKLSQHAQPSLLYVAKRGSAAEASFVD